MLDSSPSKLETDLLNWSKGQENVLFLKYFVYFQNTQNMIKLEQVTGFDEGDGSSHKSAQKHGVSQAEAEQAFFNETLLLLSDSRNSQEEIRYHALDSTDNYRLLHIRFTLRDRGTRMGPQSLSVNENSTNGESI